MWISTNRGLDRLRVSALNSVDIPSTFNYIGLLDAPGGDMYLAPREAALIRTPHPLQLRPGMDAPLSVTCAYRDPYGVEWFGTRTGFYRKEGDTFVSIVRPFPDRDVQTMTTDGDHGLWVSISFKKALFHFSNGTWTPFGNNPNLPLHTPNTATTDSEGRVWFGLAGSSILALLKDGTVLNFGAEDDDQIGNVSTIYSHGANLWIGGSNGLRRWIGGRFETIRGTDQDSMAGVSGIVETDTGDLWLNGARNIVQISAADLEHAHADPAFRVTPRKFGVLDGLFGGATQGRPIPTAVMASDGKIWFALTNGAVWIDPRNLPHNDVIPSVSIEAVTADKSLLRNLSSLRLPVDPGDTRIDYTVLSLSIPERVLFRYKLDGVDKEWQDAGNRRQAFYTQLGPGTYHFHVIASNNDGVWNTTGASLTFVIPPTTFETLWFKCLLAVLLAGVGVLLVLWRFRVGTARVRSQLSERLVERERIARELHDTLLQGLQGLMLSFQTATRRIPAGEPSKQMMENALDRADQVLIEGRDRVRALRSEGLTATDLADGFASICRGMNEEHSVDFEVLTTGPPRALHPIVMDEAYWIGREAILNAFSHSQATSIVVTLTYERKSLTMTCSDNGRGIEPALLSEGGKAGHWGLQGMRERASKIRANLEIASHVGVGTTVTLRIPGHLPTRQEHSSPGRIEFAASGCPDPRHHGMVPSMTTAYSSSVGECIGDYALTEIRADDKSV